MKLSVLRFHQPDIGLVLQGWTQPPGADPSAPCTLDVNECAGNRPVCSHDPFVPCINTPGSFTCGSCPTGERRLLTCTCMRETTTQHYLTLFSLIIISIMVPAA